MTGASPSDPASAPDPEPIELIDPLPPKWSGYREKPFGPHLSIPPIGTLSPKALAGLREVLDGMPSIVEEWPTSYHVAPHAMDLGADDAHMFHGPKTIRDVDQAVQNIAAAHCDHHVNTTSVRGGEPLMVSRCMACGLVDWDDLRKQADAYARRYACRLLEEQYGFFEYPDGSRNIQWRDGKPQMVNVQQIHALFRKEVQDGCAEASA